MPIYHYLSPLKWDTDGMPRWRAPDGCVLGLDTRAIPAQATSEYRDWCTAYVLSDTPQTGSDFTLLGEGRVDEVRPGAAVASAWKKLLGFAPAGDTLLQWIVGLGTDQSTVDGSQPMRPYVPTASSITEIWLPLHSRVYAQKFGGWNPSGNRYHNRIRDLLRYDFRSTKQLGEDIAGRNLSSLARKFGCLPAEIDADVKPLPPHTTITESFNTADSSTLGPDLSWTECYPSLTSYHWDASDEWSIVSNHCRCDQARWSGSFAIPTTSLSASDNYSQSTIAIYGEGYSQWGSMARVKSSGDETCYLMKLIYNGNLSLCKSNQIWVTELHTTSSLSPGVGKTISCTANGSSISDTFDGVTKDTATDTSYSTGTKVGMYGYDKSGQDSFIGSDELTTPTTTGRLIAGGLVRGGLLTGGRLVRA